MFGKDFTIQMWLKPDATKMTVNDTNYRLAAVMGILVFIVTAVINLVVYNMIPSVRNEEDFQ